MILTRGALAIAILGLFSTAARADWVFLPESRHQQFESYGFYLDEQSILTYYGMDRLWVGVGGTMPIYGNDSSDAHPQFVFHGSANAGLHFSDTFRLYTETVDARAGFAYEFAAAPDLRFSIGWMHTSGHAADGIGDMSLFEPALGDEQIIARGVYDTQSIGPVQGPIRFSAAVKPYLRTFPNMQWIAFDQAIDYFPFGTYDNTHRFTPYIATSLQETGIDELDLTFHLQIGAYVGNHFSSGFRQTFRPVLGYYNGYDLRTKYFQYQNARMEFAYLGFMFDI